MMQTNLSFPGQTVLLLLDRALSCPCLDRLRLGWASDPKLDLEMNPLLSQTTSSRLLQALPCSASIETQSASSGQLLCKAGRFQKYVDRCAQPQPLRLTLTDFSISDGVSLVGVQGLGISDMAVKAGRCDMKLRTGGQRALISSELRSCS